MKQAQESFHAGDLDQAVADAAQAVRGDPAAAAPRGFYAEMLCFAGQYEKADLQLEATLRIDPSLAVPVGTWRQLIRAAQLRDDVFQRGAPPVFPGQPTERQAMLLQALTSLRAGETDTAAALCEGLETQRISQPRRVNGQQAADVRELDDLGAGLMEALGSNGRYYWLDLDRVQSLQLQEPNRPLDLLWRPAEITLIDGMVGKVFIPAIYPLAGETDDLRLGRATDWREESGIVRGLGQRMWLVGDEVLAFNELQNLELDTEMPVQGATG